MEKYLIYFFLLVGPESSFALSGFMPPPEKRSLDQLISNLEAYSKIHPTALKSDLELARMYAMAYAQKKGDLNLIVNINSWLNDLVDFKKYTASLVQVTNLEDAPQRSAPYTRYYYFLEGTYVQVPKDERDKFLLFDIVKTSDKEANERAEKFLLKAIDSYLLGLKKIPTSLEGRLGLGWCYLQVGRLEEAKTLFREVIQKIGLDSEKFRWSELDVEAATYLKKILSEKKDKTEIAKLNKIISKPIPYKGMSIF